MSTKTCVICFLLGGMAFLRGQASVSLTAGAKGAWAGISANIVKAAEKMPEESYAFRPTETVRTFGQLIGHVTDANYLFCAPVQPDKKAPQDAEKKLSSKSDLVAALKASVAYCNVAFEQLTDSQAADSVKLFGHETAKLSVLYFNIAHSNEHYGNIVTYLRLKGIVPPSSEKPASAAARRLYFDRAHGEAPIPGEMAAITQKLNLQVVSLELPISGETLKGGHLLYLRAPSKTFTGTEKDAIVSFVKTGGALLLVLDEERRQKLSITGVNDLLSPFGLRLTPDTAYLPNPGAIAVAGEINRADRELPYDGGRSVEGGTPFAFQLDKDGKPAQPYAASKRIPGGGRIVVMGEGMASLFLGSAGGRRLTPVPNGPDTSLYWGKDSAIFMEEVLAWLAQVNT